MANARVSAVVLLTLTSAFASTCQAQVPAILHFDPTWCPRPEEIEDLTRYMNIRMNGCCIREALVFTEFRSSRGLLQRWGHRFSSTNTFDAICTGKVLSAEEAAADEAARVKRAEEEYAREEVERQRRERDAEREEARRRADAPKLLRAMSTADFCVAVGTAIRETSVDGIGTYPELTALAKKEAARRGLGLNYKLVSEQKIRLGISECQLLASWGRPERQNRSVGPWGVHIQHVYSGGTLVYTENGTVRSWQD